MDAVFRALAIYGVMLVLFRASGKRTLAQITTFDFVLLLIVAEATQQGLLGDDFSVTNAILVSATLISADIVLSMLKKRFVVMTRVVDGAPVVILRDGVPIDHRMKRARIDEADILVAGRSSQGIERLDQIKYAVLEQDGGISVIPQRDT